MAKPLRLMIVHPSLLVRKVLGRVVQSVLKTRVSEIIEAESASEAVKRLPASGVQVIFSGMEGLQEGSALLQRLAESPPPRPPLIAIGGSPKAEQQPPGDFAGRAAASIEKPFSPSQVRGALEKAVLHSADPARTRPPPRTSRPGGVGPQS